MGVSRLLWRIRYRILSISRIYQSKNSPRIDGLCGCGMPNMHSPCCSLLVCYRFGMACTLTSDDRIRDVLARHRLACRSSSWLLTLVYYQQQITRQQQGGRAVYVEYSAGHTHTHTHAQFPNGASMTLDEGGNE